MHDYVKTLGTVIRKACEEQGMSQASLAEKLGIDVRTIINIENFRETDSMGDSKQQLFWELHSLSEKEALELLPVIRCLAEMMRRHGSESP